MPRKASDSVVSKLKAQVDAAVSANERELPNWQRNVDARKNKVLDTEPESDMVTVPADWSRTKNKIAQLFFQVPKVTLFPRAPQWRPMTPLTSAVLNFQLAKVIHAEEPVEEALGDAINAAGVGIIYISYEAEFKPKQVPAIDLAARTTDELVSAVTQGGGQVPMQTVQQPLYQRIEWNAVDPSDFLYPQTFTKISWRKAPWLGHRFRLSRAEAVRKGWIKDDDRAGSAENTKSVNSKSDERGSRDDDGSIACTRVFYRPAFFESKEIDCRKIKVIVWAEGTDDPSKPVLHEDFKWQKYVPETRDWVGMTDFPLKPVTLTHISGQAVPPSDTEMARGTVRELNRSRSQMIQQREYSKPIRWYDVNMVDEDIVEQMRRGTWQDMIPTQGPGDRVIGEVARASYPRETWDFDQVFNHDLDEVWAQGPNQGGFEASGTTSATEAEITQKNFSVGIEHQRAKTLKWFLECAEGTLDLIQMFFEDEQFVPFTKQGGEQVLVGWDKDRVPGKYVFEARPDAAVRLDVSQKKANILNLYKLIRQDPRVNPDYILGQLFEANDLDPSEAFAPPAKPEEPKPKPATFSFKGDDLANPMAVALIQKVTPIESQEIQAARLLMADCGIPVAPAAIVPDTTHVDAGPPAGDAQGPPNGQSAPHPGITSEVTPLNRRYEQNGGEGSNPDQGMVGEGTGDA